jgi:hypothetical protein
VSRTTFRSDGGATGSRRTGQRGCRDTMAISVIGFISAYVTSPPSPVLVVVPQSGSGDGDLGAT